MSSSTSTRSRVSKQKPRQTNSKRESKPVPDPEIPKAGPVRDVAQKSKQRSSSLSKQDQIKSKESPRKSQSIDRNVSKLYNSPNISIKKSLVDPKKPSVSSKKNTESSSSSRNQNARASKEIKSKSSSNQHKISDRSSRSPMKGPSGKSNVEIAKSFVRNAKDVKDKKETKSSSSKRKSEKIKSNSVTKNIDEDIERPRTSTIRKGLPENNVMVESNREGLVNQEIVGYIGIEEKCSNSKTIEEDDQASYEEDFEEYDSDFEDSESEPISESNSSESVSSDEQENVPDSGIYRNSIPGDFVSPKSENGYVDQKYKKSEVTKQREKTFLRMSDRSFLSNKQNSDASIEKNLIKPSHSFINFASAVEQEEKKKYSNKVLQRASALLEIITLSDVSVTHLDIPPMKYDTYITHFGKNDAKQVYVQTENFEDEEIQTDEIEVANKWCQNPSNDPFGSGGDSLKDLKEETDSLNNLLSTQDMKLSSFLQNSSKVMLTILDEDFSVPSQMQATQRRNELFYSDGYYTLPSLDFLKNVPVLNIYCSSEYSNYILTIHDGLIKVPQTDDERGVICIWNFLDCRSPEHILIAHSQPTCATFGPSGYTIVIAGMVDGTISLWDLTDNSQANFSDTLFLKAPTYSTVVILGKENHHSCIVAIQTLLNYSKSDSEAVNFTRQDDSKNFHVLTLEDMGLMNIWVVVEVLKPDFSGLGTDLGLAPGGKLRLVRSSSIFLYDLSALPEIQKLNIRTFDFRLVPNDFNRFLITTDAGIVLHVNRQGGNASPRFYSSDLEISTEVRCIDCSPHNADLFLVGCSDGTAKLYNLNLVHPVKIFLQAAKGDPVNLIQWSPIHPSMFVVLSSSSALYMWNLLEDSHRPINSYQFTDSRITWFNFCISNDPSCGNQSSKKFLHMFISRDDGNTEVHIFKREVSEREYSKQLEFMKKL